MQDFMTIEGVQVYVQFAPHGDRRGDAADTGVRAFATVGHVGNHVLVFSDGNRFSVAYQSRMLSEVSPGTAADQISAWLRDEDYVKADDAEFVGAEVVEELREYCNESN